MISRPCRDIKLPRERKRLKEASDGRGRFGGLPLFRRHGPPAGERGEVWRRRERQGGTPRLDAQPTPHRG
jgi:hypothetical protein